MSASSMIVESSPKDVNAIFQVMERRVSLSGTLGYNQP